MIILSGFSAVALIGYVCLVSEAALSFSGNLLNRTLGLLKKNCQSTLVIDSSIAAEGTTFKDAVEKLVKFHELLVTSVFLISVSLRVICKACSFRYVDIVNSYESVVDFVNCLCLVPVLG